MGMGNSNSVKEIETVVKDQELIGRRHAQICDATLKLFSRKGFHRTTVREISEACGLGTGTLYSYIKTKEDILHLVYRQILGQGTRADHFVVKGPHLLAVCIRSCARCER